MSIDLLSSKGRLIISQPQDFDIVTVSPHPIDWLNDPEVMKYSEQRHKEHTINTQADYIKSLQPPSQYLEIYRAGTLRAFIGTMSVHVDEPNNIAQVGILIGNKLYWGMGLGFEAWECVCDHLLKNKGIRKIEAGSMETNLAMRAIFTKYRMFQEAYISRHFLLEDGSTTGEVRYGRFAD